MKPYTQFEDWHLEKLASPSEAKAYLQLALEDYENDYDSEAFLLAIRDVAKAMGGIGKLAQETNLNRQSLYKALSSDGNPRLDTFMTILHGLGFRLSIASLER